MGGGVGGWYGRAGFATGEGCPVPSMCDGFGRGERPLSRLTRNVCDGW